MGQGWGPRQLGASVPGALLAWDGACSTEDVFVMCSSPTIMLAGSQGVENRRSVFFSPIGWRADGRVKILSYWA